MFEGLALPPVDNLHLDSMVLYGAAYHTDRSKPHNEVNPGLGLRFKSPDSEWFYMVGDYKNSEWRNSFYFGVGKEMWHFGPFSYSTLIGGITGYNTSVLPIVLPEVALKWGSYSLAMDFVPPTPWNPGVFGFSFIRHF